MPRRLIAFLIAVYAIAFAFAAMAAIRWPSLMMLAGFWLEPDSMGVLSEIDWRRIGIAYGAPYFLAALCLYAAALSLGRRKKDALVWFMMGCFSGFPCVFLVDFETGWWRDPSAAEGAVAGAALAALLLGLAVRELTYGLAPARQYETEPQSATPAPATEPEAEPAAAPTKRATRRAQTDTNKPRPHRPVPAAIARQRAAFAAEGKRMLARQKRR